MSFDDETETRRIDKDEDYRPSFWDENSQWLWPIIFCGALLATTLLMGLMLRFLF